MSGNGREACGRCSMTTVVDVAEDREETSGEDPFAGERIELPESEVRAVAKPAVWLGRAKRRLDAVASRLVYGR